jgi:hypothetical protein
MRLPVPAPCVLFQRFHFIQSTHVAIFAAECRFQKIFHKLLRQGGADNASPEHENIHIIMFYTLVRRVRIVTQSSSRALDFICRNGGPNSTAANQDSPFRGTIGDRLRGQLSEIGVIVVSYVLMGAQVENLVAGPPNFCGEFVLQFESGVVRGQCNSHALMIEPCAR